MPDGTPQPRDPFSASEVHTFHSRRHGAYERAGHDAPTRRPVPPVPVRWVPLVAAVLVVAAAVLAVYLLV